MMTSLQVFREMYQRGWRTDRRRLLGIFLMSGLQGLADIVLVYSIITIADRISNGESWTLSAIVAATSLALTATLGLVSGVIDRGFRVRSRTEVEIEAALVQGNYPRTNFLDRPDWRRRTNVLRNGTTQLGMIFSDGSNLFAALVRLLAGFWLIGSFGQVFWWVALIAIIPVVCSCYGGRVRSKAEQATAGQRAYSEELTKLLSTSNGLRDLWYSDRVDSYLAELSRMDQARNNRMQSALRLACFLDGAGWAALFGGAGLLVAMAPVRGISALAVILALSQIVSALRSCLRVASHLALWVGAGGELLWVRQVADGTASTISSGAGEGGSGGELRFSGVWFQYPGASKPALQNVSVRMHASQVVALVGENGSGKSTFIKLALGLLEPDRGSIRWTSGDGFSCDPGVMAGQRSGVFQDFARPKTSLREAIGIGNLAEDATCHDEVLGDAVERSGLSGVVNELGGLDVDLSADGVDLSFGQWQRIAVARGSLRSDAKLFVLDEPSAALDPAAEMGLYNRILDGGINREALTLMVTHRFSVASRADLIMVFDEGRLVEQGTHADLMQVPGGVYASQYRVSESLFGE